MVSYSTRMRFSKKGALFDELPLFIISLGIISILMVGLHFLVVSQEDSLERESFEEQRFTLDGSFYLEDFLQQRLDEEELKEYSDLVGVFEEEQTLEFALRSSQKEQAKLLFAQKKEEYLEEHQDAINNYLNFYQSVFTQDQLFALGYFEVERLQREYFPTSLNRNCVLEATDMQVLPIRSGAIFDEVVVVSFSPINPFCVSISQGGVFQ